ncbi:MAG: cell wall hydrolase, partial [Eubacteriales bacterium]|nr:cell wall hydrolase [Eubacteriales bacterium]
TPKPTPKATPTPEPAPAYTVEEIMPETGYVYAKSVNLRESPNTDCRVIAEYEKGEPLVITGKSGDWYRVEIGDEWGFMLKEYVHLGTAEPEKTPEPTPKPTPKPTPEPTPEPAPVYTQPPAASLSDELYLAAQLVDEEAGADGFLAVANVIYNRVQDSRFPNTITGVVFQSGQFTPADEEAALRSVTPSAGAMAAVQQIFVDGNRILPPEIVYFRAASRGTAWGKRTYYATIGGNAFYS